MWNFWILLSEFLIIRVLFCRIKAARVGLDMGKIFSTHCV